MTVTNDTHFTSGLVGNGVTTAFDWDFEANSVSEIAVYLDGEAQTSGFTAEMFDDRTGRVTFATPPDSGVFVEIVSAPSFLRGNAFSRMGPFYPDMLNPELDASAIRDIYLKGQVDRSVKVPIGEQALQIPGSSARANKYLKFDENGEIGLDTPDNFAEPANDAASRAEGAAQDAEAAAELSEAARDIAQAAVGVDYASEAAALAGASNGDKFTYWDGNQIVYATKTGGALVELTGQWIGADKVGFKQSGTGAVDLTIQSKIREIISFDDFGAIGNGVVDDTDSFNLAINYANTRANGACIVGTHGKNYKITGSLNPFTGNRKYIDMRGARITHDAGTLFTWGSGVANSVLDGGILQLDYLGLPTPTVGTAIIAQQGANRILLHNITGDNVNTFLNAGTVAFAGGYFISNVRISTYNGNQTVINHGDGANSQIDGLDVTGKGVSRVLDETTLTGATATCIGFGGGGWDTAIWDRLLVNGYLFGLDINRTVAGKNVSNFHVSNFFFDFCANGMRFLNSASGGGINNMSFINGWAVGMDGYGIHLSGSVGSHRTIKFTNVHSLIAGKNTWRLTSQTMSDVKIDNCTGSFANRLNGSNVGGDRDDFYATFGGFVVKNSRFGRSADGIAASGVPNWQGRYGATLPTTSMANWFFVSNGLEGATGAIPNTISSTTITSGKLYSAGVRDNWVIDGASLPGYATTASITAPASTALQTNNTPFTFDLHIYGGTVTAVVKNSTTIADTTPSTLTIRPGDTWSVSYSSAPTIKRIIHP